MALLKNGPDIDHGVDIRSRRRVSPEGRSGSLGKKLAEGLYGGRRGDGIFRARKGE